MIKPLKPNVITAYELKRRLLFKIEWYSAVIDEPSCEATKLSAEFKLALLNGTLDYINSLGTAGLMQYMRDFRYAQLEQSLTKLSRDRAKEHDNQLAQED